MGAGVDTARRNPRQVNTQYFILNSTVAHLSPTQYDALERAIVDGSRIAVYRRGTEYVVIPERLSVERGREAVEATHPTTGERITLYIDEVDRIEVVR